MNKQDYIEQGRQAYKDGLDDITEAKSWQQMAFNQGWNDAHEEWERGQPVADTMEITVPAAGLTITQQVAAMPDPQYTTLPEGWRAVRLNVVTGALESVRDVNTPTRHALRSHARALVSRAQTLMAQNRPERADAVIEKARRVVSHLLGREL